MKTSLPQSGSDHYPLERGRLAEAGRRAVEVSSGLGTTGLAGVLKASTVVALFEVMERAFAQQESPSQAVMNSLGVVTRLFQSLVGNDPGSLRDEAMPTPHLSSANIAAVTGEHYGRLFETFPSESYWEEPKRLLQTRLERNQLKIGKLASSSVLDAGCGGGRYSVAWKSLGARVVTGIDVSKVAITDARRRIAAAGTSGVRFDIGSVLQLPYRDGIFDIVFSNGVLHHTENWRQGIEELVRVLRPGGFGWLYLIENPGGVFWDTIEILRLVMEGVERSLTRKTLLDLGLPPHRVFYMLDHVMAPVNLRFALEDVKDALKAAGATQARRLERGTDFDRIEQIHRKKPFAREMYGIGENRFVFTKS